MTKSTIMESRTRTVSGRGFGVSPKALSMAERSSVENHCSPVWRGRWRGSIALLKFDGWWEVFWESCCRSSAVLKDTSRGLERCVGLVGKVVIVCSVC